MTVTYLEYVPTARFVTGFSVDEKRVLTFL